ncbi:MAG TPA: electron transfer flavoprotein subunit alpha/FixB family protein [Solirubrobacteraceae bacterium]|nr:electron transfer flavoprotein subunit alpha/FixB family protein [Solirubrobacteraceae bacterium]
MSTMSVLAFLLNPNDEISQQAYTLAALIGDGAPDAMIVSAGTFSPYAWADVLAAEAERTGATAVVGPGTERGNEVMAHLAALLDVPFAANCTQVTPGSPAQVTRVRWGGSLLEEANVYGSPLLVTVAPHSVPTPSEPPAYRSVIADPGSPVKVVDVVTPTSSGVSLAEADVVVSGGRGVGSSEGFAVIEELAELLGGAVGCSRAVTSAGWRPHTDQVGQTGTKVSPDIYIACGISGATQHMAGCKGAKRLLAINPDGEASIFASADYAVIGDLHEVVPAISAEIRKARGS